MGYMIGKSFSFGFLNLLSLATCGCSENGQKWYLFPFQSSHLFLISIPNLSFKDWPKRENRIKPFLANLGTRSAPKSPSE